MIRKGLFCVGMLVVATAAAADDSRDCYRWTGDAAIAACTRVIAAGPAKPWIYHVNRGIEYRGKGDNDRAIADYDEAIRLEPKYALAYRNRGLVYSDKGDNDRAIADYDEAIRLDPKYAATYNSRGNAYRAKGDNGRAIADYDEAIRLDPKYAIAYNNRGLFYGAKGDNDRAIADYSEAIRLDPKYASAYNSRGIAYRAKGDNDRAIADYSEAIRLDPKHAVAHQNRGVAYRAKGDNGRAIADYDEAIRLDPKYALAHHNRGLLYRSKGDNDRAIADYNDAIRLDPKYASAYDSRGSAYRAKGDSDRAIADYNEAIRLDPKYALAYNNRSLAYQQKNDTDRAIADFGEAIRLDPKFAGTSASRGPAYSRIAQDLIAQDMAKARYAASPSLPPTDMALSGKSSVAPAAAASAAPVLTTDRRVALVIGNSVYENAPALTNPVRDATLVADVLKRTGFDSVTLLTNLRKDVLVAALRNFAARAQAADWAVVYYAGHGMEVSGINYLVPTDARIAADRDIGFEAVPLEQVLNAAERARKLRLVILDACRDNPFAHQMKRTLTVASRSVSGGLAIVEPDAGTLVVYAAKDGETALDGDGTNSPFASALVKNLPTPGLEVRRLFDFVRDDVLEATGRRQKPFSYGSISGRQDFYFVAGK